MLTSTHWGVYDITTENGAITSIKPFERDPDPSPIGESLRAITGPVRVRHPAVRKSYLEGGPGSTRHKRGAEAFVDVSWNEAIDLVSAELKRVTTQFGNSAIFAGSYGWSSAGRFHHAQSQVHRFMNCLGGYVAHLGTYSLGAARTLLPRILMDMDVMRSQQTAWVSLEQHCELLVAFGGVPAKNAQVNSGGISQHEVRPMLKRLAAAGVKFVNVSPLREDFESAPGAEWVAVRPNTDTAFMLGLAHTLISENKHDQAFLARYCSDFEPLRRYIMGEADGVAKSAAWAAKICDVPADSIANLARRMAASRTMINVAWSLQRGDHGEQPYWMAIALAAMLGQIGTPGGGFALAYGPVGIEGANARPFSGPVLPQGSNGVRTPIPVARITDMLENPGGTYDFDGAVCTYPDIRLIYWAGGNPFHHHQDLNRLVRAWRSKPETIIVNEQYWNPNAKFADIVLPATTMLERNDIGSSNRDRHLIAMKRALDPVAEARNDYDIFSALSEKLGVKEKFTEGRSEAAWLRHLYDESAQRARRLGIELPSFEAFWSEGLFEVPPPRDPPVMLKHYRADPQANKLPTPSGKIEITSPTIASFNYADCPGHPAWLEPAEWLGAPLAQQYPLHLMSHQPATRLHSQYDHGSYSIAAKIQGREAISLNPQDANVRGIKAGDVVRVYNARGACLAGVKIDDGVRPGVAVLPTGAWFDPLDVEGVAQLEKHGNPNVLTLDKGTSKLTQGCSAHSALVQVERYAGELPRVTAFDPPAFAKR
ncbi:MAG: Asp-tRNA(Asn)/Glu-tRNA(Gln) amidotransferase GatCAB subunit C [Betaproteobacteria bacterium]|nr:Asp-tRNA(Asn)/Glu-tRNA(Gln) amidotransferase GatCAB subunit C [Betaproteobacteria bacterium]